MTAIQVIEQIKALSPEEEAKVRAYLDKTKEPHSQGVKYADDKAAAAAAKWTFSEHADLMRKLSQ